VQGLRADAVPGGGNKAPQELKGEQDALGSHAPA
jgi:hypothetical protein